SARTRRIAPQHARRETKLIALETQFDELRRGMNPPIVVHAPYTTGQGRCAAVRCAPDWPSIPTRGIHALRNQVGTVPSGAGSRGRVRGHSARPCIEEYFTYRGSGN